jgi:hypothetical protein
VNITGLLNCLNLAGLRIAELEAANDALRAHIAVLEQELAAKEPGE